MALSSTLKGLVWVAPYFVNYAALALLAGYEYDKEKNASDLVRVERWLRWCVKNQAKDGYWNDFTGTVARYKNNGKVDAWDSSAAMFLLVAGRYHKVSGKKAPPELVSVAKNALRCIETVTDNDDGLTWATPKYKVKFLMDNIEVYAGLRAAQEFFVAAGAKPEAKRAKELANRIGKKLLSYWDAKEKKFAYALHENGTFEGGLKKAYPHGLAQLFGVAFVAPKAEAWTAAKKFSPDNGPAAAVGAERWMVTASRLGGKEAASLREKAAAVAKNFRPQNVYLYRPALMVLGLLEGADWMPSVAGEK